MNLVSKKSSKKSEEHQCVSTSSKSDESLLDERKVLSDENLGTGHESQLLTISQVAEYYPDDSAMVKTVEWVKNYLGRPHKDLGRSGPVCPFVPQSLKLDSIYFTEVTDAKPSTAVIERLVRECQRIFQSITPENEQHIIYKAIIIVFSSMRQEDAEIVDKIQDNLKPEFLQQGMMLGEFHEFNNSPGLRNPDFKPLRSPIPLLAMRHLVDTDLPFLVNSKYPGQLKSKFLRSYLSHLRADLNESVFSRVVDWVIDSEIELKKESLEKPECKVSE